MKKFISIFVLILVVICLVLGLVVSCKSIINKDKEIVKLIQENEDLKNTINTLNTTIDSLKSSDNKEQETDSTSDIINDSFDANKIVNKDENTTVTKDISDSNSLIEVSVDNKNNNLNINLNTELIRLIYKKVISEYNHTITGFSQKINDAQVAIIGDDFKDLNLVLLMDDGTIKYISIDNILDGSYTVKTLDKEKDFVRIIKVNIENSQDGTLKSGIVGIKKDGTNMLINF